MRRISAVLLLIVAFIVPISEQANAVTCPAGYNTYGSTQCIAQQSTATGSTSRQYSCNSGGILSGTTCIVSQNSYSATATNTYYCAYTLYGTPTLSGTNCTIPVVYGTGYYSGTSYSCPTTGYTLSGTDCSIAILGSFIDVYSCPTNRDLAGTYCYAKTYPYTLIGWATLVSHTQQYSHTAATATPSGWTVPILQAAQSYAANYTTAYSCPSGSTLDVGANTCTPQNTTYSATYIYTGLCPVHYSVNSATGICDAVPYSPAALVGPILSSYICTGYNQDGTSQNWLSSSDVSYIGGYLNVVCGISAYTPADITGSYLCQETKTSDGNSFYYLADGDLTGATATSNINCSYQGVPTESDLLDFSTFTNTTTGITICATEDFSAWVTCNDLGF